MSSYYRMYSSGKNPKDITKDLTQKVEESANSILSGSPNVSNAQAKATALGLREELGLLQFVCSGLILSYQRLFICLRCIYLSIYLFTVH